MYKTIIKLSEDQENTLVSDFLKNIGMRIKQKRAKKNISQDELADCLHVTQSIISRYESGDRDMPISMLPLMSTYCKFPLHELFPKDESQNILDTFAAAVSIKVERKKRQEEREHKKADKLLKQGKILKGQVFEVGGIEVFEPFLPKVKPLREQYKDGELDTGVVPYTEMEFCDYVKAAGSDTVDLVVSAGQFLRQLEGIEHKESLKNVVADCIINELVIERATSSNCDESCQRAYAYYRALYNKMRIYDRKDRRNEE